MEKILPTQPTSQRINDTYERMLNCDVKYRFVIDMKSVKQSF